MNFRDFFLLVDTQARLSLKSESAKLYLSFLWWILEPMLFVLAFYFVFNTLLGARQENFLIFLMCAKVPYMWFSKAVTNASGSLTGNKGIIGKVDIVKAIFPYASVQTSIYKELPVVIFLMLMCISQGFLPSLNWLWLIPLIFLLYLMILACSLLSAWLVCYVPDFRMAISMGMLFLMFTSGIFFDIRQLPDATQQLLFTFNPMAFICDGFRQVLMNGQLYNLKQLLILLVVFTLAIALMHYIYKRYSREIAARVLYS